MSLSHSLWRLGLPALVVLAVAAVFWPRTPSTTAVQIQPTKLAIQGVSLGMSDEELLRKLGPPMEKMQIDTYETCWYYANDTVAIMSHLPSQPVRVIGVIGNRLSVSSQPLFQEGDREALVRQSLLSFRPPARSEMTNLYDGPIDHFVSKARGLTGSLDYDEGVSVLFHEGQVQRIQLEPPATATKSP
jgi:hypothetical protein